MKRTAAIFFFLLCAAHAQARNLYVSLTGSHDTNAPAFSSWATAATNIQAAIDAADAGDTVRVAPGTYTAAVTINKNDLTVQGGRGTLWDADRTIIDRQGKVNSIGVNFSGATNSSVVGLTIMGATRYGVSMSTGNGNSLKYCIVRHNVAYQPIDATGNSIVGCIVVGNTSLRTDMYRAAVRGFALCDSTIIEANASDNSTPFSIRNGESVRNSIYANAYSVTNGGGNITNLTFTKNGAFSVLTNYNISPASKGVGSNLVWAGVAAYIPRLGSLAQGAGVGYAGIDDAKSGDGGPALVPAGAEFFGCDSSTNRNHGEAVGGVTASTNSPFAGGGSAAFDGKSAAIDLGSTIGAKLVGATNITIESWVLMSAYIDNAPAVNVHVTNEDKSGVRIGSYQGKLSFFGRSEPSDSLQIVSLATGGPTNQWTHFAAVVDYPNDSVILYLNGAAVKTQAVTFGASSYSGMPNHLNAGIGWNSVAFYWNGNIGHSRLWNVARTPEQIAAAYTNRLTGTEEGLVGYWPLKGPAINPIDTGPFNLDNPIIHPTYMEAF